ncbi:MULTISPECIES: YeeE/YedE family protein [unclassified Avibacterium]|uniref:YeeE/YedE family protein n=1 Tax=unclassified Avibacterium TaxID=2685287 RepID=UPI002188FD89|nr:YeeE/YedE family protein [Avibacterium sp. 20-129]MCW9698506.1 YeeE/YedE family protein [Avibacterium sp. 20-129]URL02606.1 YeeE/YedE family protein [Avibacterium sp. 20-126]
MYSGFIIGLILGFLLQRGQFCFVSGFRSLYQQKNLRFCTALLIAISIQSIGIFTLAEFNLIHIPTSQLPVLATILGGLCFGVGMTLANCCASGAWFRSAEGAVGSYLALISFTLTMAATQSGFLKHIINHFTADPTAWDNIYLTLNLSPWSLVSLLIFITALLYYYQYKNPRYHFPKPPTPAKILPNIFAHYWSPFFTAGAIGLLGIIAWYFSSKSGRNFGFGIAVPSANVVQYIVTGQQRYLNWGMLFVLGIPIGSYLSAWLAGDFKWQMPEPKGVMQRVLGGVAMGIGAALAGGCTITNAFVSTAYFSWQGWLATLMILLGSWLASLFTKPTQCGI